MKKTTQMTRRELLEVPLVEGEVGIIDALVIVPTRRLHSSGYAIMQFVLERDGVPIGRIAGFTDVIHIDGIGGWGKRDYRSAGAILPKEIACKGWMIDLLPKSICVRLFVMGRRFNLEVGDPLSSFEVFAVERHAKEKQA